MCERAIWMNWFIIVLVNKALPCYAKKRTQSESVAGTLASWEIGSRRQSAP